MRPSHQSWSEYGTKQLQPKKIVLPETEDERTLIAADLITKQTCRSYFIGNPDKVRKKAQECGANIEGLEIIDPNSFYRIDEYTEKLFEIRKGKLKSLEEARTLLDNVLYFGAMLVKLGEADGMIAGASHTTADVLRPAFQLIKTAPGIALASAYFAMLVPNCDYGEEGFFIYADAAGVPEPSSEELADITITSCMSMKIFLGLKSCCAMLSYSTKGSASHPLIDKVIKATELAKQKRPDLLIDGELQRCRYSAGNRKEKGTWKPCRRTGKYPCLPGFEQW